MVQCNPVELVLLELHPTLDNRAEEREERSGVGGSNLKDGEGIASG